MHWRLPMPRWFLTGVLALVFLAIRLCRPASRLPCSSSGVEVTVALLLQAVRIILDELQFEGEDGSATGS